MVDKNILKENHFLENSPYCLSSTITSLLLNLDKFVFVFVTSHFVFFTLHFAFACFKVPKHYLITAVLTSSKYTVLEGNRMQIHDKNLQQARSFTRNIDTGPLKHHVTTFFVQ